VILIDANVLVYLFLRGDKTEAARALVELDSDWQSETFCLVEFSNVLATYVRSADLSQALAHSVLKEAEKFMHARLIAVSNSEALEAAIDFHVSAYDGRFLALARRLNTRFVTEDAKLRAAAPDLTQSIARALGRAG